MKLRLLKRIREWEQSGRISASDADVSDVIDSLRDDLEKLLNTRRGTVLTTRRGTVLVDEGYGLPDFTHLMNGYAAPDVDEIERELLNQLRKYENRLDSVELEYQQPDRRSVSLQFGLNGVFQHKQQEVNFRANIAFADNGSIRVGL